MKHTRKFVSLVLGLAMMLSMNTAAFASIRISITVTLSKTYQLTNDGTTSPAETFPVLSPDLRGVENAGVGVTTENARSRRLEILNMQRARPDLARQQRTWKSPCLHITLLVFILTASLKPMVGQPVLLTVPMQ